MVCQMLRPIAIGLEASVADLTVSPDMNLEKQCFHHLQNLALSHVARECFGGSAECHPESSLSRRSWCSKRWESQAGTRGRWKSGLGHTQGFKLGYPFGVVKQSVPLSVRLQPAFCLAPPLPCPQASFQSPPPSEFTPHTHTHRSTVAIP